MPKRIFHPQTLRSSLLLVALSFLLSAPEVIFPIVSPKSEVISRPAENAVGDQIHHRATAVTALMKIPISFEPRENPNQFLVRGSGHALLLSASQITIAAPGRARPELLRMRFKGSNSGAVAETLDPLPGKSNYLIGADPAKWRTQVPTYSRVRYNRIYPGISALYYGHHERLEYDLRIDPGFDPRVIKFKFNREVRPRVDRNGELVLQFGREELREPAPIIFQEIDGERHPVIGGYIVTPKGQVSFVIGEYDNTKLLTIDPVLVYSTYLGGSGDDTGSSIAIDGNNNTYVAGTTNSTNFPIKGAAFSNKAGLSDIFVTKIAADGSTIIYSTYVGGSGQDRGDGIAVDGNGSAYVVGRVDSTSINFPTTPGVIGPTYRGGDFDGVAFKLNPQGSGLSYSTYIGAEDNDSTEGVAVDANGNAYLTGGSRSQGFPVTATAVQSTRSGDTDAYLMKLNSTGTALMYSTFLGGGGTDRGSGVAVDQNGNAYVAGYTASQDFPTQDAFQNSSGGGFDGFVTKIDTNGTGADSLVFCSFLGGVGDDKAFGIAIDSTGANVYVTGQTSSPDFPVLNPIQPAIGGSFDAFVAKISSSGSKIFATYLGGSGDDRGTGIVVNSAGAAYVTGFTNSTNFPTVSPIQPANGGGYDAFLAKLNPSGSALLYSTYLGGSANDSNASSVTSTNPIALDAASNAYLAGFTLSTNFPTANAFQSANAGGQDAFVIKIADAAPTSTVQFNSPTYSIQEDCTFVDLTVNRTGDTSGAAKVDYTTVDATATARRDYITAVGTLSFAPGETSKTIAVLINEDSYIEGNETFTVNLNNPSGVSLGASVATVTIVDDPTEPSTNAIDDTPTFVCQQYHDFLNRQADAPGQAFWTNEITSCGTDQSCIDVKRVNTSGAFYLSIEFQQTGYLVERMYKTSYGDGTGTSNLGSTHTLLVPIIRLSEFLPDTQRIGQGVIVGQGDWQTVLENNKQAYANEFVQRPRFITTFSTTLTPAQFVDALNVNAGSVLSASERTTAINFFGGAVNTTNAAARAQTLRFIAEDADLVAAESNRAFVLMQYYGYLRRDPNASPDSDYTGYDFWLQKLNAFNGNFITAEMVKAFLTSIEYRQRFGP
jgi:Calx-beta domain/Beta-propeller repeat